MQTRKTISSGATPAVVRNLRKNLIRPGSLFMKITLSLLRR